MTREGLVSIPLGEQRVVPWRNGGGTTREVAVRREGALADFRWRVSVAQVTRDGPFSAYPGIDRLLWLLRGAGMRLVVDGREAVVDRRLVPVALRGEANVAAYLIAGPTEDLNVMVERATTRADARVVELGPGGAFELAAPRGAETLVLALDAGVSVEVAGHPAQVLGGGDALVWSGGDRHASRVQASAPAAILWARFVPLAILPMERRGPRI